MRIEVVTYSPSSAIPIPTDNSRPLLPPLPLLPPSTPSAQPGDHQQGRAGSRLDQGGRSLQRARPLAIPPPTDNSLPLRRVCSLCTAGHTRACLRISYALVALECAQRRGPRPRVPGDIMSSVLNRGGSCSATSCAATCAMIMSNSPQSELHKTLTSIPS